jgi:SagB-type dehydrogenase family enzyme
MNDLNKLAGAALLFHERSSFGRFDSPLVQYARIEPQLPIDRTGELPSALGSCLYNRRSNWDFDGGSITLNELSVVTWACYGAVAIPNGSLGRTTPSAGGLYPLHPVVAAYNVHGLAPGLYSARDGLTRIGDLELLPTHANLFHTKHIPYEKVAVLLFLVGSIALTAGKYGERGYRYLLLEAGHAMQNACLACAEHKLAHVPIGGFDDDLANSVLGDAASGQFVLYVLAVGRAT